MTPRRTGTDGFFVVGAEKALTTQPSFVMPGLIMPGIHVGWLIKKTWMAGQDPAMTVFCPTVATPAPVAYFLAMTAAQKPRRRPRWPRRMTRFPIIDFGSQVTQLIARRVREEGVYSEIVPFQKAEAAFEEMKPKAVILSGGPESVHEAVAARAARDLRVPAFPCSASATAR